MLPGVNYLAHGIRFLDRPYFLIGSAIPDMLNVVDRRARVRRRTIETHLDAFAGDDRELLLGMQQHLLDDHWFHSTAGFFEVTGTLGELFRQALGPDDSWHCGFLGHVVTELLMDASLIEDHPDALDRYYAACSSVDRNRVEQIVASVTTQPPQDLARFIQLFIDERFLYDYISDEQLLRRLNQVMRRVGLRILPRQTLAVLQQGRKLVRSRMFDLLPGEHFSFEQIS